MMLPVRRTRTNATDELHLLVRSWFDNLDQSASTGVSVQRQKLKPRFVDYVPVAVMIALPTYEAGACQQIKKAVEAAGATNGNLYDDDTVAVSSRRCAHAIGAQMHHILPMAEPVNPDNRWAEMVSFFKRKDLLDGDVVDCLVYQQRKPATDTTSTTNSASFYDAISNWDKYDNYMSGVALDKKLQPTALLDCGVLHMLFSPVRLLQFVEQLVETGTVETIASLQTVMKNAFTKRLTAPMEGEGAGFRDGNGQLDEDLLMLIPGRWIGLSPIENNIGHNLPEHSVAGDVCAYAMLVNGHTGLPRSNNLVPVIAGQVLASYTVMLEDALTKKQAPTGIWTGPVHKGGILAPQSQKILSVVEALNTCARTQQ